MIAGISRIRNESLILEDTLRHFLKHCDQLYIYDDLSTDNSVDIMRSFDNITVIEGKHWSPYQWQEETKHRAQVLDLAKHADMCLCFDADERIDGDLPTEKGGYTLDLFDGYMVEGSKPYTKGELSELDRMWGVECREILMYFDPKQAIYEGLGQREPIYTGLVKNSGVKVKHFGKCLSVEHWEDTCDFYTNYFPQWRDKWAARKGKAIHSLSDFGTDLLTWGELCKKY